MAVELVTGHAGSAHISGEDVGSLIAGLAGTGSYSLGSAPVPQMTTANLLSIPPCDVVMQGRHVRLTGTNTVGIDNGMQSGKRADLVYLEYSLDDGSGTETVSDLTVAKGTTGASATDPTLPHTGSILDSANPVDVAVCRVTLDGLSPTAEWLLPVLPTAELLGGRPFHGYADDLQTENSSDMWVPVLSGSEGSGKVQHRVLSPSLNNVGIWGGTVVSKTWSGNDFVLMSAATFKDKTGYALNNANTFVGVCSGDDGIIRGQLTASIQMSGSTPVAIIVRSEKALTKGINYRINYCIVHF